MKNPYHEGELEVQTRVGVRQMAARVGNIISSKIPQAAQDFLDEQQLLVAGSVDAKGQVWASVLVGPPGFIVSDEDGVIIRPNHRDGLLSENLQRNPQIGLIAIEPATRHRMRLNGIAHEQGDFIMVESRQVFSNCPKYIQAREIEVVAPGEASPLVQKSDELDTAQTSLIEQADTFFIASYHPAGGVDASHRGGLPGFVRVLSPTRLAFPDYAGNMMFQTLGNLTANPSAGLLFVDFESGATLQLTGQARIIWDGPRLQEWAGAQRLVEFEVKQTVLTTGAAALRGHFLNYSKFNPLAI